MAKAILGAGLISVVLCMLVLYWSSHQSERVDAPPGSSPELRPRPCGYVAAEGSSGIQLKCFWITTERDGRFELPVAVIYKNPASVEALLHIAGGPGDGAQTTPENLNEWIHWYAKSGLSADLILYTARATPGSSVDFICDSYERFSWQLLGMNVSAEQEYEKGQPELLACLERFAHTLVTTDGVPSSYPLSSLATSRQAADARHLLHVLGYRSWHLWGVSYGTRVALVAAEQEQSLEVDSRLESLILDSVYPPGRGGLEDWPALLDHAFNLHKKIDPGFPALWQATVEALQERVTGVSFKLENWHYNLEPCRKDAGVCWQHEKTFPFILNVDRLLSVAYYVLYDETLIQSFHLGLSDLNRALLEGGDAADSFDMTLVLESFLASALAPGFSPWVFYATECSDNGASHNEQMARAIAAYPRWHREISLEHRYDVCRNGRLFTRESILPPLPDLPPLPILLLAGELDPVTPLSWAEELARLSNRVQLVAAIGIGHSVLFSEYCEPDTLEQWLQKPGSKVCQHGTDLY